MLQMLQMLLSCYLLFHYYLQRGLSGVGSADDSSLRAVHGIVGIRLLLERQNGDGI
jgi:hypothetical protein